jgi:DUF971 family protein
MNGAAVNEPPSEIALDPQGLDVHWGEEKFRLAATHLRNQCRCAACKQLALQGTPVVAGAGIQLTNASPVGSYAVQLHFSDGHERGIYPWSYLRELAGA